MRLHSMILTACLAAGAIKPATLFACGYDDPSSIALGSLNWVYPDALYVRTAVSQAEAAGLLPAERPGDQTGLAAFHRATATMKSFGTNLADPRLAPGGMAISVVLVPQAMWTRFEIGPDGVVGYGHHEEGPAESDLVIVTEESVIRALVDGRLDSAAAEKDGLLRFYGNLERVDAVRAVLSAPDDGKPALPVRFLAPEPTSGSDHTDAHWPEVPAAF
jgi:hypothetical protein